MEYNKLMDHTCPPVRKLWPVCPYAVCAGRCMEPWAARLASRGYPAMFYFFLHTACSLCWFTFAAMPLDRSESVVVPLVQLQAPKASYKLVNIDLAHAGLHCSCGAPYICSLAVGVLRCYSFFGPSL